MIAYDDVVHGKPFTVVVNERGEIATAPALSIVIPYYRNPQTLHRQIDVWRDEWATALKRDIEVVLVDDGSPTETAGEVLAVSDPVGLPHLSLYRVTEDRPWHQHGARNLGAHVARGRWLLMTDMDHVIPAHTLAEVLRLLPGMTAYEAITFGRVDAPATPAWEAADWPEFARTRRPDGSLKPHPNSFVVSRDRYWRLGGYDEDLAGYATDIHFRRRLFGSGTALHHLDHAPLVQISRDVIPDANTTAYARADRCDVQAVLRRKAAEGRAGKTTTLNFPWERIL